LTAARARAVRVQPCHRILEATTMRRTAGIENKMRTRVERRETGSDLLPPHSRGSRLGSTLLGKGRGRTSATSMRPGRHSAVISVDVINRIMPGGPRPARVRRTAGPFSGRSDTRGRAGRGAAGLPATLTRAGRAPGTYLACCPRLCAVSGSAHPQAACVRLPASYAMALRQYLSGSLRSSAGGTHTHTRARARERERERASERERERRRTGRET
jgi:hypothetical protein